MFLLTTFLKPKEKFMQSSTYCENSKNKTHENQKESSHVKQYFINDENFKLLKHYQQRIFDTTEVSPALRKIVNELITVENLEKVMTKFVSNLSN